MRRTVLIVAQGTDIHVEVVADRLRASGTCPVIFRRVDPTHTITAIRPGAKSVHDARPSGGLIYGERCGGNERCQRHDNK